MVLPPFVSSILAYLGKELIGKIFFPKNQKELVKEANQKLLFENNVFVINIDGKWGVGDLKNPPKELLKILETNLDENSDNHKIETRIIKSDFYEQYDSLNKFFEGDLPLRKIAPYLTEENESILVLSEYIRNSLSKANHNRAQITKNQISEEYGTRGRKLCNLYLRGYINKIFEEHVSKWISSEELTEEQKFKKTNELIEEIVSRSDSIYFISNWDKKERIEKIEKNIISKMDQKRKFIAIHAGGKNVSKLKKLINNLENTKNFIRYSLKSNEYFDNKSKCRLMDSYLLKI
jgi:hypothetical protein